MSAPIKKRPIELMNFNDEDDSSSPSFDSPAEDDDYNFDEDKDDDDDTFVVQKEGTGHASPDSHAVIGKTFQAPQLESQESEITWSPHGLGTQPVPRMTTPTRASAGRRLPTKKRKVSMSPTDTLAHIAKRRSSPRSTSPRQTSTKLIVDPANEAVSPEVKVIQPSPKQPVSKTATLNLKRTSPRSSKMDSSSSAGAHPELHDTLKDSRETSTTNTGAPEGKKQVSSKKKTTKKTSNTTKATKTKMNAKKESHEATTKEVATSASSKPAPKKTPASSKQPATKPAEAKSTDTTISSKQQATKPVTAKSTGTTNPKSSEKKDAPEAKGSSASIASASSKKKKKKRSFQDDLLELMFMSCKPYTVKALAQQLKTNEASVNFCLLSLGDKGWILKKEFTSKSGTRSKELFWANQEAKSKELYGSLQIVPAREIQAAREELTQLQQTQVQVSRELTAVRQEPSNADLNEQLASQEELVLELETRLKATYDRIRATKQGPAKLGKPLSAGMKRKGLAAVSVKKPLCSKQLKKRINDKRLHWKKRKEKCTDFIEQLADGMEKKVKDVIKLLDLETDELIGVKMPPKHEI